ncbi:hypothetical protein F5880DRAFT_1589545 [Lentinula raphanica]|nr:hypothetical protein F5880DRAFT_1589545 [Lentinula raphanica]
MSARASAGMLSDPDQHGRTWLQLDDSCKVQLSAVETRKYKDWRESMTRNSQNTTTSIGQSTIEDRTNSFFRTLNNASPLTSVEGSDRSVSVAQRKVSRKMRQARIQLFEDQYVLDRTPERLKVGQLGGPDSLGWRWYQCTEDVQVLLPPDAGVQYSFFLTLEEAHLNCATTSKTVEKFNKTRTKFNELCIRAKSTHPVRGIAPSPRRYALPVRLRCHSLDKFVGRPQDDLTLLMPEDIPADSTDILSRPDEYWRRWLCINEGVRILLPADIAAQLTFLRRNGVSHAHHPLMRQIFADIRCLSCEIVTEQLLHCRHKGEKLFMMPPESRSQTLDEAVAHIEVNICRSTRKQIKHTTLKPQWHAVVCQLEEYADFPPSRNSSSRDERDTKGDILIQQPEGAKGGVVRRVARRRRGTRNLRAPNVNKELPPLPPENRSERLSTPDKRTLLEGQQERLWIRRKTRILT